MNKLFFLLFIIPSLHAMVRDNKNYYAPQPHDDLGTLNWKLSEAVNWPERIEDVASLIAAGAQVNALSPASLDGCSIFLRALIYHTHGSDPRLFSYYKKLFSLMLAAGARLDYKWDASNHPLILATGANSCELVKLFLRYGANPSDPINTIDPETREVINTVTVAVRMLCIIRDDLDRYFNHVSPYSDATAFLRARGLQNKDDLKILIDECAQINVLIGCFTRDFLIEDDANPRTKKWRKTDANIANALMNREMGIK